MVANSSLVRSVPDINAAPHEEQKRLLDGAGEPHEAQKAIFHKCTVFDRAPGNQPSQPTELMSTPKMPLWEVCATGKTTGKCGHSYHIKQLFRIFWV